MLKIHLKSLIKNDSRNERKLIDWLVIEFGEKFVNSIVNGQGTYYWTHQTKCPSRTRQVKPKCSKKWGYRELSSLSNLKYIITLGAEAYRLVAQHSTDLSKNKVNYYDYLWREIQTLIQERDILKQLKIKVVESEVILIALPHPSGANSLSNFLPRFRPLIEHVKDNLSGLH